MRAHLAQVNDLQRSEWTIEPLSIPNKDVHRTIPINHDDNIENTNATKSNHSGGNEGILARHPCLFGFLAGVAVCGAVLIVFLTIWLASPKATTPSTTTTTTTATSTTSTSATSVTTSTTTSSTTATTTTTVTSTTSTSTTTTMNPCLVNNLHWNPMGVTVMSSPQISRVSGLYFDSHDTLYAVDEIYNSVVWKLLNNTSTAIRVAGQNDTRGPSSLLLDYPQDVYVDSAENMYVTDYYNYRVQKYASGSMSGTTIAGTSASNGTSLNRFAGLRYFAFDAAESYMFITDSENSRIMRYSTSSTSGSNGVLVAGGNGAGNTTTTLNYPWGIAYRSSMSDDLYITNLAGHSVIRWTVGASSGVIVAGTPGVAGSTATTLNQPMGIKLDAYLNMFVVDNTNHRVQMFCYNNLNGITIAGNGTAGNSINQLYGPRGIAFDSAMNLYVSDFENVRVQKFSKL